MRRFLTERDRFQAYQHRGVVRYLGGCYRDVASLVSVVEHVVPWKLVTDDYLASQPRRAVALYEQLLDLLDYLERDAPNAPLVLCDFHRGQFGVARDNSLRLLDVDSMRAYNVSEKKDMYYM